MSSDEVVATLDEVIRTVERLKRRIVKRKRPKKQRSVIPLLEEWKQERDNKWSAVVDRYKFVIVRRHDRTFHWYVYDRRSRLRIASNRKPHDNASAARGRLRMYYENCLSQRHRE